MKKIFYFLFKIWLILFFIYSISYILFFNSPEQALKNSLYLMLHIIT